MFPHTWHLMFSVAMCPSAGLGSVVALGYLMSLFRMVCQSALTVHCFVKWGRRETPRIPHLHPVIKSEIISLFSVHILNLCANMLLLEAVSSHRYQLDASWASKSPRVTLNFVIFRLGTNRNEEIPCNNRLLPVTSEKSPRSRFPHATQWPCIMSPGAYL